jgi:hypothetical protein
MTEDGRDQAGTGDQSGADRSWQADPAGEPAPGSLSWSAAPGSDVLVSGDHEPPRRNRSWWLVGIAVALVATLVGGVAYGVNRLSGGGAQPEDALPAGAVAFAKLDLDPSAGQKIDAIRFLRKFPSLRSNLSEDSDLRKQFFDQVADQVGWTGIDFDRDVKPWLGQRVGVAAYAPHKSTLDPSSQPDVVVALQVTDHDAAVKALTRLVDSASGSGPSPGFVVGDDYALLAQNPADAQRASRAARERGTLGEDKTFASDLAGLDSGVAAFWLDGKALGTALPMVAAAGGGSTVAQSGRTTYVLRFDGPDVLELVGKVTGASSLPTQLGELQGMDTLPSSTVAAFGLADGRKVVGPAFDSLRKNLDRTAGPGTFDQSVTQLEAQYGIRLPDDIETLLGSNLVAALDRTGLGNGQIAVAARVQTDGTRAVAILDRLTAGLPVPIAYRKLPDGYVIGSDQRATGRLAGGGSLGSDSRFTNAVPDLKGSSVAIYVDLAALVDAFAPSAQRADLAPLDTLGMTAVTTGGGSGTFRLRLVTR